MCFLRAQTLDQPFALVTDRPSANPGPAGFALAMVIVGAIYLNVAISWRQAALFLVGAGAGVVLYHAAFGFTSSWRIFVADGRGAGLRAQMLMLALTSAIFFPLLASGHVFGQAVRGSVSPAGVSVIVGAFLFGIGMQLGGGCASGTLYSAGGGSTRMFVTLLAFIAGSVIGAAHMPWWTATPALKPISLVTTFGAWTGLAISLTLLGLLAAITIIVERARHGRLVADTAHRIGQLRVVAGPWPLIAGAIGLSIVNIMTLLISGRPWGVTGAFALWGAKALTAVGVNVAAWPYWSSPAQAAALKGSVLGDVTSVMNVGIMLGALAAAGLAGRFEPVWHVPARSIIAAVLGGLLLGYGARIAYGCNIGALFGGIASGSLHGWVWAVAAFAGSAVGIRFRPFFDLRVERSASGC
jgi:uncharacterized membrane protein YedE/YeeE